jgi:hypothetical protein
MENVASKMHGAERVTVNDILGKSGFKIIHEMSVNHRRADKVRFVSPSDNLAHAMDHKRQNRFSLEEQLGKIDKKLAELSRKLDVAKRHERDTTVLESLMIKCAYRRHVVYGMVEERETERAEIATERLETNAKVEAKRMQFNGTVLGERAIIPVSKPKTYLVGKRIIKDHIDKHGTVSRPVNRTGASASKRKARAKRTVQYVSSKAGLTAKRLAYWQGLAYADFLFTL